MQPTYLLLVFALAITALGAVLVFAVVRLSVATRNARQRMQDTGGETALLTAALSDAVERIRQQERLTHARAEASERLSQQIIASLASGLLVVDVTGGVRILNPAGQRLLGIRTAEPGKTFRDLVPPSAVVLADLIEVCLSRRSPIERRTIEIGGPSDPGAAATHLGVSLSPMFDEDGALQGAICLFTDLTAVVDLEERVRLQDSLAQVGELTAGMAHEFRNGLATIHGYSRLLDPGQVPPEYRPYIEGLREGTVALREIVDNFLSFARPAELSLGPVTLTKLVHRVAEEIRDDVAQQGGTVQVQGEFGEVEGDEVLLRQALSNLCRNALEACSQMKTIPRLLIQGTVDCDQSIVKLTVSDNGPGIAPDQRERVFRPFFTTKPSGTGLGLSLTQKIIVTHNGRVTAGASEQGGASIEVVLPLNAATHRATG
jgi:signal transduction histidine kinase